ncbi:MAG TPA: hypothetical protein VJT50_13775, partial [Pyrinomonadaceae bacterium]|nr:hypothetical protein [Pyrinomonadaceae bacterium]
MKRWQKLVLIILVVVIASQVPFAYRRYRLGKLNQAIQQVNALRQPIADEKFVEYRGVMHVHSFLGGHSPGTFDQIIDAAKSNNLDFVMMTEHTSSRFNTAALTLKGVHDGILFINGNEISVANGERLLILPGDESSTPGDPGSVNEVIDRAKTKNQLAVVAYPTEFKSWSAAYDGVEVYNVFTNAKQINPLVMLFDGLWSYRTYPDLLFATFYQRPSESLGKWDDAIAATGRRLVATAGNDAHANVGINVSDNSGRTWIGFKADPYERSFRLVRMHVLISAGTPLTSESLLAAIAAGHCFIAFDLFGDAAGFRFTAENGSENKVQGDEIAASNGVRLTIQLPLAARAVLLKNGKPFADDSG